MASTYENFHNLSSTQVEKDDENKSTNFTSDDSKINLLTNILQDNFYGCDIMLCLFMAALQSYRVDRCLRPFPTSFVKNSDKDIDGLREVCRSLPSLDDILKRPKMYSKEIVNLLVWLLCLEDQPFLKRIPYSKIKMPCNIEKSHQPHYTYEIVYPTKTEAAWQKRRGFRNSFFGYHGSQIDNFYSILKVGLQQHFSTSKDVLYGHGIYLTSEISISMHYSPFGQSWKNSMLGKKHSIIALCEVIDDIEKVKRRDDNFKDRAVNEGSISGNIPDKYYVVIDSEMVRLKYLFVYKEDVSPTKFWIKTNLTTIFIAVYVILILCIGFFQSPTWTRLQRHIFKLLNSK